MKDNKMECMIMESKIVENNITVYDKGEQDS